LGLGNFKLKNSKNGCIIILQKCDEAFLKKALFTFEEVIVLTAF